MFVILGSHINYDSDDDSDDDSEDFDYKKTPYEDKYEALLKCSFCNLWSQTYAEPNDSYGNFQIRCDICDKFMGIESYDRIDVPIDNNYEYWWKCELSEFTHYNKMSDFDDYDSPEFKELEKKYCEGNTVWVPFPEPRYQFTQNECYNSTFLTKHGDFHFGCD